jgi:hypothetical protein
LVLAGIQAQWRPLRAELFPQVVLLDLSDPQLLIGQAFKGGKPQGPTWSAPVPARTCRAGLPVALDALGDFIGDLLLEHSTPDAGLVVALPWELGHWRVLDWPEGSTLEDPAEELRERRVDLGWPFSLDEAALDVQPLAAAPGRSLVVGISHDALDSWIEVFAIAGGSLRHLIPAQACLHMALQQELASSPPGALVALLQGSSTASDLLVWRDGVPEFQRSLPRDQESLVPALAQALGYCRSQLGGGAIRLLLDQPFEAAAAIRDQLGLELDVVDRGDYGSLHLAGLGLLEMAR